MPSDTDPSAVRNIIAAQEADAALSDPIGVRAVRLRQGEACCGRISPLFREQDAKDCRSSGTDRHPALIRQVSRP
jgi:hypothetical protein